MVQGEYIPNTTYSNALSAIQANKAVMIKLATVAGRYYIPYSSSNAEILASAGTVSGSNQSIELYLLKWTASNNTITITGTKEGCTADGGTTGQVLAKKSDANFDTEWIDAPGGSPFAKTVLWHNNSPTSAFESQTITTSENGFDYSLLIIEFSETASGVNKLSVVATNTTKFGTNSTLLSYYGGYRTIRTQSGTTWTVSAGFNLSTNASDNNAVIPLNIIGYK